ncbi:MAG: hypothetical protein V7L20_00060 [Nostoc sp.]
MVTALGFLSGLSLILFVWGGWTPLVLAALILVITGGSVTAYTASLAKNKGFTE